MIHRRQALSLIALAISGVGARATSPRIDFYGTMEQGSLVIGRAGHGAQAQLDGSALNVSADGVFAFGLAWDQTAPAHIGVHYEDGSTQTRDVVPIVRKYEVQSIKGLPEEQVTPPQNVLDRIAKEHTAVANARLRDTGGLDFADPFEWPATGIVSGTFGSQRILNGEPRGPHFGVDIAAPTGSPIHAPAAGIVSDCGDYYLEGGFTLLDHGHGVSTCYMHQSKRLVTVGDTVARGQLIGLIGQTGRATGPHVHWGMNWFQIRLDPSRSTREPSPPAS